MVRLVTNDSYMEGGDKLRDVSMRLSGKGAGMHKPLPVFMMFYF